METLIYFILVPMVYIAFATFFIGTTLRLIKIFREPKHPATLQIYPLVIRGDNVVTISTHRCAGVVGFILAIVCFVFPDVVNGDVTVIGADKDNTLFESGTGATSSGEGPSLFAGRTRRPSDPLRRAAVAFDLTSIPAGSTVTAVTLDLVVTRNPFGSLVNHDFTLHPLERNWQSRE